MANDINNTDSCNIFSTLDLYTNKTIKDEEFKNAYNNSNNNPNIKNTIDNVNKLITKLRTKKYIAQLVPSTMDPDGNFWNDYPFDYMTELYGDDWYENDYMYFVVYMDENGSEILTDNISLKFSTLNKNKKIEIINLLNKYFDNKYIWNGKNTQAIEISYDELKNFKNIDIKSLNNDPNNIDDVYPLLKIKIYFNKDINLFMDSKATKYTNTNIVKSIFNIPKDQNTVNISYTINTIDIRIYELSIENYTMNIDKLSKRLSKEHNIKKFNFEYNTNNTNKIKKLKKLND